MPLNSSALSDEATVTLIGRARTGDNNARETLVRRVLPSLRRWAHGRLPARARGHLDTQDLVQDTVVAALQKLENFESRHQGALQAYLRQSVVNRIRDEVRRIAPRPHRVELSADHPDDSPSPLEQAVGSQAMERYEAALATLPPDYREAIVARAEMGMSYEEVAVALGKATPNAARLVTRRAVLQLARRMAAAEREAATRKALTASASSDSGISRTSRKTEAVADTPKTAPNAGDGDSWFVATQVADGSPIDWHRVQASIGDPVLLDEYRQLQVVSDVAEVHRSAWSERPDVAKVPSLAPGERWGHLVVVERIGEGSFGEVYRARDPWLDREVALKLLKVPGEEAVAACLSEARRLAHVRDPHVVSVHGADVDQGRVGLWMELVHGATLQSEVASKGPFSVTSATRIGRQVCRALAAIHDAGMLHGDVKAQNLIRETNGRVVLMDFGASSRTDGLNTSASRKGTPAYLAPELLRGGHPSVASDIYAVGVLLFYLVTNSYPVEARSIDDLRRKHDLGRITPLNKAMPDLSPEFSDAVQRALSSDPAQRYSSADAMEDALAQVDSIRRGPRTALDASAGRIDAFSDAAAEGLGARRWLLDHVVTRVIRLRAQVSVSDLERQVIEGDWSFPLDPFVLSSDVDVADLVFVAVYPSGVVRGISVEVAVEPTGAVGTLTNPLCLLDPHASDDGENELICEIEMVGLPYASHANPT